MKVSTKVGCVGVVEKVVEEMLVEGVCRGMTGGWGRGLAAVLIKN